jgi:hypothetical protein
MAAETTPYIDRNPGDLITAEDWDGVQVMIKEDIGARIEAAKEDIRHTGVDQAGNADKFSGKSETDWTNQLNDRYAAKVHDHEGQSVYRRYIKRFTGEPGLDKVLLDHDLGRFPLVDVYELLPVTTKDGFADCKLLFYYGHQDADDFGLVVKVYRESIMRGLPFEQILAELGVHYEDDDTIEDVLNDMWDALRKNPNDEITHGTSPWVSDSVGQRRTVLELKRADQWSDFYLAIQPRKCGKGADPLSRGEVVVQGCQVDITHVNYGTLLVETHGLNSDSPPLDLMFLLRI